MIKIKNQNKKKTEGQKSHTVRGYGSNHHHPSYQNTKL
jgi:hypothetical protein